MNHRKKPERRTFLQDRFDILIRRQKNGVATFNELTELDEIVNRDPEIREKVIRESLLMEGTDDFQEPSNNPETGDEISLPPLARQSLLTRIKTIISRIFISKISTVKIRVTISYTNQALLV
jgi:hypothetical protein